VPRRTADVEPRNYANNFYFIFCLRDFDVWFLVGEFLSIRLSAEQLIDF